jgi:hypothetical protein
MSAEAREAPSNVKQKEAEPLPLQLEVVRESGGTPGRPLFLTARRFIRICHHIEQGESASEACRLELVTYAGFRRHVKINDRYRRRLKEAEETREEFLREFHIANIRKHAPRNLLSSLWWLERRFPSEFALRTVNRNLNSSDQPIGDKIDEDQLRRYAALMAGFQRENEAKAASEPAELPPANATEVA